MNRQLELLQQLYELPPMQLSPLPWNQLVQQNLWYELDPFQLKVADNFMFEDEEKQNQPIIDKCLYLFHHHRKLGIAK
jgi:hypothetical protein